MSQSKKRCAGLGCPSMKHCNRYCTDAVGGADDIEYAALWVRREAGATACDQFISSLPSTFEAKPFRGVEA